MIVVYENDNKKRILSRSKRFRIPGYVNRQIILFMIFVIFVCLATPLWS